MWRDFLDAIGGAINDWERNGVAHQIDVAHDRKIVHEIEITDPSEVHR